MQINAVSQKRMLGENVSVRGLCLFERVQNSHATMHSSLRF